MGNLKVGDEVKIKSLAYNGECSGLTGRVTWRGEPNRFGVKINGKPNPKSVPGDYYFKESELTKVRLAEFKVGDTVRIRAKYIPIFDGRIGRIARKCNALFEVTFEGEHNPTSISGGFHFAGKSLEPLLDSEIETMTHTTYEAYSALTNSSMKENKNMKSEKIVALWNKEYVAYLMGEKEIEIQNTLNSDPLYCQVKKQCDELNDTLTQNGYQPLTVRASSYTTNETDDCLNLINEQYAERVSKVTKLCEEINTMLSACDTYEQEMKILFSYCVVECTEILNKNFAELPYLN